MSSFIREWIIGSQVGARDAIWHSPKYIVLVQGLVYLGVGFLAFLVFVTKASLIHVLSMRVGSNQE